MSPTPPPAHVVANGGHWAQACHWLAVPPSTGQTRQTRGVSFLKTFKRKTKARVCGLDLEQPRDREPLSSPGVCRRLRSSGVEEEGPRFG